MSKQTLPTFFGRSAPFLRSFQDELAHMLDLSRRATVPSGAEDNFFDQITTMPAIDVAETENSLEVSVEVPGVTEDDLDITVQGDTLVIKGEKSSDTEDKKKDYHLIERRYGSFRRHIPLGFVPEEGAITAAFDNGVLTLSVNKPANAQSSVQKVQISKS